VQTEMKAPRQLKSAREAARLKLTARKGRVGFLTRLVYDSYQRVSQHPLL